MLRHQRPNPVSEGVDTQLTEAAPGPVGSPRRSRRERGELAEIGVASGELPFRAVLEERFGEELSWVKVRREPGWLRELGAKAASTGDTVVLPLRPPTLAEVAHEVAHVLQARLAGGRGPERPSGRADPAEREAEAAATEIAAGRPATVSAAPSAAVQRLEEVEQATPTDTCEHDPLDPALQPPTGEAAPPDVGYARGLLSELREGVVPAWDAAVGALDADGAEALLGGVLDRLSTLDGLVAYLEDGPWAARVGEEVAEATRELAGALSPQVFAGNNLGGGRELPRPGPGLAARVGAEGGLVVGLLRSGQEIAGQLREADQASWQRAFDGWQAWRGRPCNLRFLDAVLDAQGMAGRLATVSRALEVDLGSERASVEANAEAFGATTDVATWDEATAAAALSPSGLDVRVSDEDARTVCRAVVEASPEGRLALLHHLRDEGRLHILCENLAPNDVKAMVEGLGDAELVRELMPHTTPITTRGAAMTMLHEATVEQKLAGNEGRATAIAAGATAWDLTSLGVPQALADNDELALEGNLSRDAYTARKAAVLGGTAALLGATACTALVIAPAIEGLAVAAGIEGGVARLFASTLANMAGSVAGQLTADGVANLAGAQDGLSSPAQYALGAATAGLVGMGTAARVNRAAGAGAARTTAPPPWAATGPTSKAIAAAAPWADNTSARLYNGGARAGHSLRAVAEGLLPGRPRGLDLGPLQPFSPLDALRAPGIAPGQPVAKLLTAEDAARFYPQAGPGAPTATLQGFAGDASHPAWQAPTADALRQSLGLAPPAAPGVEGPYARYNGKELVVAQGRTGVVPDVPVAGRWGGGTPIGGTNPETWHRPGVGRTVGGVPEGVYPPGTPFRVDTVSPVGQVPAPAPGAAGALPTLDHLRHFPTLYGGLAGLYPGAAAGSGDDVWLGGFDGAEPAVDATGGAE